MSLKRNASIEVLRIISAFLIVWYHSGLMLGHAISYSGLIILIIISIYLSIQSNHSGLQVLGRLKRIMLPWILWFFIYGLGNIVLFNSFFKYEQSYLINTLIGTHIHLWYLPFIFIALTFSSIIKERMPSVFIAYIAWVLTVSIWIDWSLDIGAPFSKYIHAVGGVILGLYFGCNLVRGKKIHMILTGIWLPITAYLLSAFSIFVLKKIFPRYSKYAM